MYMDNAFPQIKNLEKMYDMKVYGTGTMRPHFGFPPELHELVRKLNDKNGPLDVGEYEWMMAPLGDNPEASFLAVVWMPLYFLWRWMCFSRHLRELQSAVCSSMETSLSRFFAAIQR